jgi:hypothetical protein
MNLKNISRDAFWHGKIDGNYVTFSSAGNNLYNSSGTVNTDVGTVYASGASVASGKSAVGINISPPLDEPVPYRVKLYVPTNDDIFLVIGNNEGTLTGSDDTFTNSKLIHVVGELDEIFMISPLASTDSGYSDPLVFAIQTSSVSIYNCALSVQKLDVSPPQFGLAVP